MTSDKRFTLRASLNVQIRIVNVESLGFYLSLNSSFSTVFLLLLFCRKRKDKGNENESGGNK